MQRGRPGGNARLMMAGERFAEKTSPGPHPARELIGAALVLCLLTFVAIGAPRHAAAEDPPPSTKVPALWTDPETGQVFTKPGPGRVPLTAPPAGVSEEKKKEAPAAAPAPAEMAAAVEAALPSWLKHFSLSTLIYMDWSYYMHTSWGPQFLTQINPPGPGNNGFNSFDLTRSYLNFVWTPSDRFLVRITPNIYREVDTSGAVQNSQSSSVSTNVNGNLSFRLKYGYLQVNDVLYKGQNFKIGQIENPLIPWEEDLYGYRFVNLVPLNFFAYSSTDLGIAALGPIMINGAKYADYWFGVYNGSSFHAQEQNEERSPQGRLTIYPLAETPSLAGLGMTGFFSYGYNNVSPDINDQVIKRLAALGHYSGKGCGIAFEFDQTRNENNFSNFFSASGPTQTIPDPTKPGSTIPNPFFVLYNSILNPNAPGTGYAVFGHYDIPNTPFSLFGLWNRWYPNTNVDHDPLDSDRYVGGIAYKVNNWLRLAADSQNLVYFHSGAGVPPDIHAIFTNVEINYK
jgi:hypothetical protein